MHRILLFDHLGLLLIYQLLDALKVGKIDLLVRFSKFEKSLLHDFDLLVDLGLLIVALLGGHTFWDGVVDSIDIAWRDTFNCTSCR